MSQGAQALEKYLRGEWNYSYTKIDSEKDEATITMRQLGEQKSYSFKVENYSKGEKGWKIVEDADA
jgi:hypothetical protein